MRKYILLSTILLVVIALATKSCDGMDDNFRQYLQERNYSGRIENLVATPGFERVVLRWDNPTDQRSQRIRIVVSGFEEPIEFDSLVSEASIEGLTDATGRTFTVFTLDAFGNQSVPVSATAIPVTRQFMEILPTPLPIVQMAGVVQAISFFNASNVLMQFAGSIRYTVTAPNGTVFQGVAEAPNQIGNPIANLIIVDNDFGGLQLLPVGTYRVDFEIAVVPVMGGVVTEDVVWLEGSREVIAEEITSINLMGLVTRIVNGGPAVSVGESTTGWIRSDAPANPVAEHVGLLIDNRPQTKFLAQQTNRVTIYWSMWYRPFSTNRMQINTANDGADRDPRDWTLYGRNSEDEPWVVIHQVVDWNPPGRTNRLTTFNLEFPLSPEFKYFRWNITRNWGSGSMVQVGDWLLWHDL